MKAPRKISLQCPIPKSEYEYILMAHGGGGRMTRHLIEKLFLAGLGNEILEMGHDGAFLPSMDAGMAFTTDSFVVDPIFFPGGNIGDLAINGTVNDLLCCGAQPLYISLGLILEEGFLIEELWSIIRSIGIAAEAAGAKIVTGDTKVVEKGKGDKIYINTSGIGRIHPGVNIDPTHCSKGDVVLINGEIGDHGIAIMLARQGMELDSPVVSDTQSLTGMMMSLFQSQIRIHVLRDPTRGGLASALNEICDSSGTGITLYENELPINDGVRGACELMGFDPLYVANEGKILVILPESEAELALSIMRSHKAGKESRIIGRVNSDPAGILCMETTVGTTRIVDMISGEQLPRIC
ncbi:MAG: hydrogenase expression/formation protein HypE [Anaerolineales bacterium]|nr:hydrogenase expression/formation protein HypE [Anaerolineales bacterium]